jgi:hypothetical protein
MPRTPDDPTKAQAWLTQNGPQVDLELYVPRGNKGDPGGITLGTTLGATNLNEFKTPGIYRQDNGNNATLLNNYPVTSSGILYVDDRLGGQASVMQTYYPFMGTSGVNPRQHYRRYLVASTTWGPWECYVAQRVDQTAGRAIYTWNPLNSQDQLVYGDTGWRTVTPNTNATVTGGTVRFRRIGNQVYLRFVDLALSTGANGFGELFAAADIPIGFRPNGVERSMQMVGQTNNATYLQVISIYSAVAWLYQTIGIANSLSRPPSPLQGTVTWVTDEAWPTTLPGTAFGSIPNL